MVEMEVGWSGVSGRWGRVGRSQWSVITPQTSVANELPAICQRVANELSTICQRVVSELVCISASPVL